MLSKEASRHLEWNGKTLKDSYVVKGACLLKYAPGFSKEYKPFIYISRKVHTSSTATNWNAGPMKPVSPLQSSTVVTLVAIYLDNVLFLPDP